MRFIAEYRGFASVKLPPYSRPIDADTLAEADKIAKAYARKNYRVVSLKQKFGED